MKFVLTCNCDSTDMTYDGDNGEFRCRKCGKILKEEDAGKHLLGDFDQ